MGVSEIARCSMVAVGLLHALGTSVANAQSVRAEALEIGAELDSPSVEMHADERRSALAVEPGRDAGGSAVATIALTLVGALVGVAVGGAVATCDTEAMASCDGRFVGVTVGGLAGAIGGLVVGLLLTGGHEDAPADTPR